MTEARTARDRFDQRHFIELYRRGLLDQLPLELGPMPIADLGPQLWDDLVRWRIVDGSTGELDSGMQKLFDGITDYEWAAWGTVLLYNERRPMIIDLPEEFFHYGVQHAIRDIPRVPFLIGVRGSTVTTVVLANGEMEIRSDPATGLRDADLHLQVGTIVLSILDPAGDWEPYPMPKVSILAPHAGGVTPARRNADTKTRNKEVTRTTSALQAAGSSPTAAKVIGELLSQDNVATAQITVSRRAATEVQTVHNNAAGVMFFGGTNTGTVVSYPVRSPDGRPWINYEPATPQSLASAIKALHAGLDAADPADIVAR